MKTKLTKLLISLLFVWSNLHAGEADIIDTKVECSNNLCRFKITVQHNDEGWEHYAKHVEILNMNRDKLLGSRLFHHPHVQEQPFTRTATVLFKEPVDQVIIRAFDTVHEFGGKELVVEIPHSTQ